MRASAWSARSAAARASLVDRFDAALLRAALPEVRDAAIERFFSRPIVHHEESGWLRCSVNEYIRAAVREHDCDTDDAWSQDEWRAAAARMVADLQDRLRQDANDPHGCAAIPTTSGAKSASIIRASSSRLSYATRRSPVADQYQPE